MDKINFSPNGYNPENIHNNSFDTNNDSQNNEPQKREQRQKRKRQNANEENEETQSSILRFFNDKRTHYFIGITLIFIAAFITIASISHIKYGAEDQSTIVNNSIIAAGQGDDATKNSAGSFGAYISQIALTQWLGIGAFILIIYISLVGYSFLRKTNLKFWSLTFKSLILAIATSIILGFITYNSDAPLYLGGQHGYHINDILFKTTGLLGTTLVNILIVILVVFIFLNEIHSLYSTYKNRIAPHIKTPQNIETEDGYKDEYSSKKGTSTNKIETETNKQENLSNNENIDNTIVIEPNDNIVLEDKITLDKDNEVSLNINTSTIEIAEEIGTDVYDPTAELSRYRFPTLDLLISRIIKENSVDQQEQEENKERITKTLRDYTIEISHIEATVGPTVTLYEIIPAEGVRIAKIKRLEDDIALSLAALGIRIIAPIPGKGTIGIEVPNKDPQTVSFRSIIASKKFQECKYALPMAMGATISNDVFIADLTKMPHLLVAGATGQGKSVGLNAIIASLLYKKHPAELKFVLIDPKMVEFSLYSKLERHYLAKLPDEEEAIITDPSKVVTTLNSLCIEMDNRYNLLRDAEVRSIAEYNAKFISRKLNPEKGHKYLPYIVMIVDEFADLIMTAGKEVETPIARIAQKARAVGMHMIIATQRPSTNVITGIIKANFPGRIAFRVSQMVDSKTILDRTGANQLIGRGDMLFSHNGDMQRVQCAFIDTPEVEAICNHIDDQIGYEHAYYLPEYFPENNDSIVSGSITDRDPLFEEAARFIINSQTASTSSLQRRYSIGYNRAGKIMDQMESAGIVGPSQGGKPRQVLIDSLQLERILESFN